MIEMTVRDNVTSAFRQRHPVKETGCRIDEAGMCALHGTTAYAHETFGEGWSEGTAAGDSLRRHWHEDWWA